EGEALEYRLRFRIAFGLGHFLRRDDDDFAFAVDFDTANLDACLLRRLDGDAHVTLAEMAIAARHHATSFSATSLPIMFAPIFENRLERFLFCCVDFIATLPRNRFNQIPYLLFDAIALIVGVHGIKLPTANGFQNTRQSSLLLFGLRLRHSFLACN